MGAAVLDQVLLDHALLDRAAAPGQRGTLRIATAGSVDDGKSTLIGRLLHDTKTVFEDQLIAVVKASRRYGDGETNLALLTDGLRAEREQGITIDVAHRYFATQHRSFIVADTPGHAQYTRNMVTGASTADVAIVLVDARHGVVEQTRRHAFIATLLGVKAIVVAVNKMDLIGWDEAEFTCIAKEVDEYVRALPTPVPVLALPISALLGDNVVDGSSNTQWYEGPSLLQLLEGFDAEPRLAIGARVHVQRVIRPNGGEFADFRGYAGVLSGGTLAVGDAVIVQPAGLATTITALHRAGKPVEGAEIGHALVVELADKIDVARGDVLVAAGSARPPTVGESVEIDVCWMIDQPLVVGSRWWFKHGSRTGRAVVHGIDYRHDLYSLEQLPATELGLNDLGRIRLQLSEPIVADRYVDNPDGGRLILIDEATNTTAGAAMVVGIDQPVDFGGGRAVSTPEEIKLASDYLRGDLQTELADGAPEFSHDSIVVLKFHGIYQQDDRDVRRARASKRLPLDYSCMVRAAVPGGVITPEQWLALDKVSDIADGTMRLTTRQGVQFHVVLKDNLHQLVHDINGTLLSTLAACGDVVRNIMANPFPDERQVIIRPVLQELVQRFRPQTTSYWEIWVDGDKAVSAEPSTDAEVAGVAPVEPVYGDTYLPRKFKIGIAWPGDNSIDVFTQDVGIVPTLSKGATGRLTGFVVFAGGGLGMSHAREHDTYPRLASELGWVTPEQLVDVVEAVVTTQRDHGNRNDRHRARLKYLIDEQGVDWLKDQVEARSGVRLQPSPGIAPWKAHEYHEWLPAGATYTYGLPIPSGRVADRDRILLRSALRELAGSGLVETFIVTPRQDLLISGVKKADRKIVETVLRSHGVPLADDVSALARLSIACPALPTCGQALGEAERVLPQFVDALDKSLVEAGIGNSAIRLNMTGCPNGCARPYNAEIGIVGRTKTNYDVYVGGSLGGERLADRLRADVALADIPALLAPVFAGYASDGATDESFGDYCNRVGTEQLVTLLPAPTVRRRAGAASADAS